MGNSAAVAIAYSGGSETMKIADPDTLDGSNLNRIRAGIKDLGENKTFIAAKQIYELNPYANLILYPDGLTPDNLKDFLLGEPKLNIVVDEMDNLKMKIFIRLASRSARLPVIMATDNGDNLIIDVDRFDQNPYTPPFNELPDMDLDTIAKNISFGEKLDLTLAEKIRLATNIVGAENVTPRMQDSLMEVGKTLISWPQLAVAAFTSGTTLSYIAKKIAVGEEVKTGKSHLSLDESFLNLAQKPEFQEYKKQKTQEYINYVKKLEEEDKKENFSVWETKESDFPKNGSIEERLKFILNYAVMAPSAHNTQPWKFKIQGNSIEIFVDKKAICQYLIHLKESCIFLLEPYLRI